LRLVHGRPGGCSAQPDPAQLLSASAQQRQTAQSRSHCRHAKTPPRSQSHLKTRCFLRLNSRQLLQEKRVARAATKRFIGSAFTVRLLRYNQRRLNSVLTQTQPVTARSNRCLARTALVVAAIGALWFILLRQLSNEWSINEQYSYGWFVPFLALFLFWLRWADRPDPE